MTTLVEYYGNDQIAQDVIKGKYLLIPLCGNLPTPPAVCPIWVHLNKWGGNQGAEPVEGYKNQHTFFIPN